MKVMVSSAYIFTVDEEMSSGNMVYPIKGSTLHRGSFSVADWYRQQSGYFKSDVSSKPTKKELDRYTELFNRGLKFAEENILACMSDKFMALFEGKLLENGTIELVRGSEVILAKEDDSDVDDFLHVMSLVEVSEGLIETYKNNATV